MAIALLAGGCQHEPAEKKGEPTIVTVHTVRPILGTIDREIEQPGFVSAFEQTSIFSKVSGFIKKFNVDIGQDVHKGQELAEIFVPELNEQVSLDKSLVEQAEKLVDVAKRSVENAEAQLAESKANVGKYEADVVKWQSEVERFTRMVAENALDKETLTETHRQLDSAVAAKKAAEAAVRARDADRLMAEASLGKAKIDVKVAEAAERKAEAMLDYTSITAPYDGVVTVRNANTGDYVQAVTGDKSTTNPSAIFVVQRVDTLRIYFDVDERNAAYVEQGKSKAAVRTPALSGLNIPATVARTSWAVRENTHALWTEIDLTKKEYDGLRPGMYVYVTLYIHRPDVYTLPEQAVKEEGNQKYCYLVKDGKAVRTPVDTVLSDGKHLEVDKMKIGEQWTKVTGQEEVIVGDLSELNDGQAVQAVSAAEK